MRLSPQVRIVSPSGSSSPSTLAAVSLMTRARASAGSSVRARPRAMRRPMISEKAASTWYDSIIRPSTMCDALEPSPGTAEERLTAAMRLS